MEFPPIIFLEIIVVDVTVVASRVGVLVVAGVGVFFVKARLLEEGEIECPVSFPGTAVFLGVEEDYRPF